MSNMPKAVTVTRSTAPQETTCSTCADVDYYNTDIDLPAYYYPAGMLTLLLYAIVIIGGLFIAVNAILFSGLGILLYIKRNIIKCEKCKKIIKVENKNLTHCPYCGTELNQKH